MAATAERHRWLPAVTHSVGLGAACYVSFWLGATVLPIVHSLSPDDNLLGGMTAVIATLFVYRTSLAQDRMAALARAVATLPSFALCLVYLLIFPFSTLGLAVLIAISTLLLAFTGRPADSVTAGITTAVVLVVAAISPHNAWEQPVLRVFDTAAGGAAGLAAAWIASRVSAAAAREQRPAGR